MRHNRLPSGAGRSFALVAAMTMCPRCGSSFLQPLRCEAKGSDVVLVELRCSDCMTWLKAPHTRADMRELDRLQAEFRGRDPRAVRALGGGEHGGAGGLLRPGAGARPRLRGRLRAGGARRGTRFPIRPQISRAIPARIANAPPTIPAIAMPIPGRPGVTTMLAGARARAQQPRRRPAGASKWPIDEALPSVSEKPWRLPLNCVAADGERDDARRVARRRAPARRSRRTRRSGTPCSRRARPR